MESHNTKKISTRFRNLNILFFAVASVFIAAVMIFVLQDLADTVSKDYAELHSELMLGTLNTYFSGEIALIRKSANANAVVSWFADEYNEEKKRAAYDEMMGTIGALKSDFLYLALAEQGNEYAVQGGMLLDEIQSHGQVAPGVPDDAWYFETISSDKEYLLNVDIDKEMQEKVVWLNYKVMQDGRILGAFTTGLEFSATIESLFAKLGNQNVRVVVVDEYGIIQMDSALAENGFFYDDVEAQYFLRDQWDDGVFLTSLGGHLAGIDGYFTENSPLAFVEIANGPYDYATIAPINATTWTIITFYDSSSLFNITRLIPLLVIMLVLFVFYIAITNIVGNRYVFKPFEKLYEKTREQNQLIMEGVAYASKIQRNLLPSENAFREAFSDYCCLWKPKDIVGGDIYWIKSFEEGTVLCVCDCTGHGTPGALLTMLVVSAFESSVTERNCKDPADIIWELEKQLVATLHVETASAGQRGLTINDGCDLAVLFIAKDGAVTISAGNMHVYVCDGAKVTRVRGQRIRIGEGLLKSKDDVKTVAIPANPKNKFYIASDGLYEQVGGAEKIPFGYDTPEKIILESHGDSQSVTTKKIWQAFEAYRGSNARRDDLEFIAFKP